MPSLAPSISCGITGKPGQFFVVAAFTTLSTFGSIGVYGVLVAAFTAVTLICGSAKTWFSVRSSSATLSTGKTRQFTVAVASCGNAFSACPADISVGTQVVRSVALYCGFSESRAIAETLYNDNPISMDHADVPSAVFSQPPIGTVGLTEDQARKQYGEVDIYQSRFRPMKNTLSGRDERTFMKLVVDAKTDRVVGCHMLGPDAPEIIQGIAIAIKCGATKKQFDATVGIHPSAAEEFVTMRDKYVRPEKLAAE